MKKSWIKNAIVITLIVVGILVNVFWEIWGRENILYTKVLTANQDILRGQVIKEEMITEKSFARDTVITDALSLANKSDVVGQVAKQNIPENGQLNKSFLYKDDFYVGKGESIFKIPSSWIDSRSSSVRRGDTIQIYADDTFIGEYKVAFVKDQEEREVKSSESQWYSEALERTDSTGVINNIEIIATLAEYKELYKVTVYNPESLVTYKLLIVQKLGGDMK